MVAKKLVAASAGAPTSADDLDLPEGAQVVASPLGAQVWRLEVVEGSPVRAGDPLVVLEAMKTETAVLAPCDGVVVRVACEPRQVVAAGAPLVAILPAVEA